MTVIDFQPEEIHTLAEKMLEAHSGIQGIVEQLDEVTRAVEPKWHGDSQQAFLRFYREWRKGVDTHSIALKKTSEQLNRMAEAHQSIR